MHVIITGTRGIPAAHGGFETFAQDLSLFLVSLGHSVTVYCQKDCESRPGEEMWRGVRLVNIPAGRGTWGTIEFDYKCMRRAVREKGVILTLGYNTGLFSLFSRLYGVPNVMNMDGIEWKRKKWSLIARGWLLFNEWIGSRLATHLIADHPAIAQHLQRHTKLSKITVIPYGAEAVVSAPVDLISQFGLFPKDYYILIARPEPENSILEIVLAASAMGLNHRLVVLGNYASAERAQTYQQIVLKAASENVRFLGAIYEPDTVRALRFYAKGYVHGHQVGGTNPSLVESLAMGKAIFAHDNPFNRWVAGTGAQYFRGTGSLIEALQQADNNPELLQNMEYASRKRHSEEFQQEVVLGSYLKLLLRIAKA